MSLSRNSLVIIILLVLGMHLIIYYQDLNITLLYGSSILLGIVSILVFFNFKAIKTLNAIPVRLPIVKYAVEVYGLDKLLLSSVFLIILFMEDRIQSVQKTLFFISLIALGLSFLKFKIKSKKKI
jgi:hypothetical protein